MSISRYMPTLLTATVLCACVAAMGQDVKREPVDRWEEAKGTAAGTDLKAQDEAQQLALRAAVEQACGLFIKGQTKVQDYQTVYDKVLSNTVGYVLEFKVVKVTKDNEKTTVFVRARVSTQKFEENWAHIAHTVHQAGNPRVIIAIVETTNWTPTGPAYEVKEAGVVQSKIEDFFNEKGIQLVDRGTAEKVSKRDILLASLKDDVTEVAALGAKFKADVVIVGTASAKYGKQITLGEATLHQYTATLNIRAVQTDSARILASKSFNITPSMGQQNAEDKVLAKLGEESAPKVLAAVVESWSKRENVSKTIELMISGMDRKTWKTFEAEALKIRGVQNLRLREITESMATIDVEYGMNINTLADRLEELKDVKLEITEQNPNRLKAKVVK